MGRTWRGRALRLFTWGHAGCNPIAIPTKVRASSTSGYRVSSALPTPPSMRVLLSSHAHHPLFTLSPPHSLTNVHRAPPAYGASTEETLNNTYTLPKSFQSSPETKHTPLQKTHASRNVMHPKRNADVWPGTRGRSNGGQLAGTSLCRRWHSIQAGPEGTRGFGR